MDAAKQAISGICEHYPDDARRWLHLAHVYDLSGLPVAHFKEMVQAGRYCFDQNLPIDAALYYRMALESILATNLSSLEYEDRKNYMDAAIGLCVCKDYALSPHIQRTLTISSGRATANGRILPIAGGITKTPSGTRIWPGRIPRPWELPITRARIELSHAMVLLARIRIREKKMSTAGKLLKKAWEVFSKVNPDLFPKDLKPYLDRTSKNALWVESLLEVGDALSSTRNRNDLLGRIIRQAIRIAGAERGFYDKS